MKNVNKYLLLIGILGVICLKILCNNTSNNVNIRSSPRRQSQGNGENIIEEYEGLLPEGYSDLTDINLINERIGAEALLGECIRVFKGEGTAVLRFLLLSLSLSAISAICSALCSDVYPLVARCASLISLFAIVRCLMPLVDEVAGAIVAMGEFLLSILPILTGISVTLGHTATATSQATAMSLTLSFFGGEGARSLTMIVKCLFILAVSSVFTKEGGKLMATLKNIFMWGLGIITTLLSGVMSVQTLISRSADNATMMATRYAISNMLPLAGGVVSGAMSTLVGGMSYYASVVGSGAIAVIVLTALTPLISLLMYKLALSVVLIFTAFIGNNAIEGGVKAVSGALDALIALYAVTTVIYAVEVMLFLRQGIG